MEELITRVILVCIIFALDVRDIATHQTRVVTHYETAGDNDKTEMRRAPRHHLHSIRAEYLTENKVSGGY
jgi:hypothetical protein